MNVAQAARYLAVSPRTVNDLAGSGRLKHHRIGTTGKGRLLFERSDLQGLRERTTVRPRVSRLAEHMKP